jgi:hypothetical protein
VSGRVPAAVFGFAGQSAREFRGFLFSLGLGFGRGSGVFRGLPGVNDGLLEGKKTLVCSHVVEGQGDNHRLADLGCRTSDLRPGDCPLAES